MSVLQTGRYAIVVSCQPLKLFKEDERKDSVGSKTEIVRCESFPQRENPFLSNHSYEHFLTIETERQHKPRIRFSRLIYCLFLCVLTSVCKPHTDLNVNAI